MSRIRRFKRRVAVYRGGDVAYYSAHAAAAHLLDSGLARVRQRTDKVIAEIELLQPADGSLEGRVEPNQLGLKPGSYGIQRELLDRNGHWCYGHRHPWSEVAAGELIHA